MSIIFHFIMDKKAVNAKYNAYKNMIKAEVKFIEAKEAFYSIKPLRSCPSSENLER